MKYYLDTEFHEYEKCTGIFNKTKTPTIDLISIGIVSEDEREYYAISKDFDVKDAWKNEWLRENVLKLIYKELHDKENIEARQAFYRANVYITETKFRFTYRNFKKLVGKFGKSRKDIAKEIKEFVYNQIDFDKYNGTYKSKPYFYAYYADYDWVVFTQLFGRMVDLPKGFPRYCIDLKQILDEKAKFFTRNDFFTTFDFKNEGLPKLTQDEKIEHLKLHVAYPTQENEHNASSDAR